MAEHSQISKDILRRVRVLYFVFLLIAVAVVGKVLWVQYGPEGGKLREKAREITYAYVNIPAERGDILSGDGRLLASSITEYTIRMDFAAGGLTDELFNANVDSLAYCLSTFFKDKSKAAYKTLLVRARANKSKNRYKQISPRRVSYLEEKQIKKFPIFRLGANRGGYIAEPESRRVRPHGSLASRTIGTVNKGGTKVGIEGAFDSQLTGKDGLELRQKVSGTFRVPVPSALNVEPVNGMDVVTTLNVDIQDVAESMLKRQLEAGNADWGTVVLMEVATGEIHAMANLTRKAPGVFVEDFNYAIGRRAEPGSTFKLATLITLLEDGGMSLDQTIDCENGVAKVGVVNIRDDHKESVITLRRVFEVSSNIGFAKSVYNLYKDRPERFVNFINEIGFDKPLGMQIPGEQPPLIKDPSIRDPKNVKAWDGTTLVKMSYGYALEVTPMQTLALYNAVANGGKLMRPLLVKEIQSYGNTVRAFEPEVLNPAICSQKTLALVRECLEGVTEEGTGARALKNPYYKVAAKTGTAQMTMASGGYRDARGGLNYLATLVGYFPADNPKYSCIVAIKTYYGPGQRNTYYGASLAGPVFRAIADRVYASNPSWHTPVDNHADPVLPPASDIKGGREKDVVHTASKLSVKVARNRDDAEWVKVDNDEKGRLVAVPALSDDETKVPSVIGMGLSDAMFLLEQSGLRVSFTGKGKVKAQSVAAGSQIKKGQTIVLTMGV